MLPTLAFQGEHIIRYLSMWDNKYQRYFKGHVQEVTTLAMNPKNDMLLSGARVSSKLEHCLAVQLGASLVLGGPRQCSCLLPALHPAGPTLLSVVT